MLLKLFLLLTLMLLDTQPTSDDFVPKDIIHAVAIGCSVSGYDEHDTAPYAEAKVFVKWNKEPNGKWDFTPVMSHRTGEDGGIFATIEDCRDWLAKVEATMKKTLASKDDK